MEAERSAADLPAGAEPMLVPVDPVSPRRPKSILKLWRACRSARRQLRAFRPDVLLAMGSYTSVAPVLAARSLGVPVVLHEANAIPGSAVAHLARFAKTVCVCFPDMERHFPKGARLADTGLPLRAEFEKGIGGSKADPAKFSLLVMGGSQGARDLNRAVVHMAEEYAPLVGLSPWFQLGDQTPEWPDDWPDRKTPPLRIVHLAGTRNEDEVRRLYAEAKLDPSRVEVEVVGFEHDMARRYAEADLAISRAGASSCFELALVGLPVLFEPLRGLARDHQVFNACAMEKRGAGIISPPDRMFVSVLACDPEKRSAMRKSLLAAARPDAASRVADEVERNALRASDE